MVINRRTNVQLNRGKRLKDAVKLRRPSGDNGASASIVRLQPSIIQSPILSLVQPNEATNRILEHLNGMGGNAGTALLAQDERTLQRALALLGPDKAEEYSAAARAAIQRLNELAEEIQHTALLMVKDTKDMIKNKMPAWMEAGAKTRTEAMLNLMKCQDLIQQYGRGLMGAPDKVEEHLHRHTLEGFSADPLEALQEVERLLTGRTIQFLPPARDGGQTKEQAE